MDECDVLVVGGGPAGSSCARRLIAGGAGVTILDQAAFPRDKVCAGWITPDVLDALEVTPAEYGRKNVLQPIRGFRIGVFPGHPHVVQYPKTVSYGILRREFDSYLLRRTGARVCERTAVTSIERDGRRWIVNGNFRCRFLVGAGGHFCPVARRLGARPATECAVIAQRLEYPLKEAESCPVAADVPELYFCRDFRGYGWCFRKGNVLNVGFGRLSRHAFGELCWEFLSFLDASRGVVPPRKLEGHAYLVSTQERTVSGDGVLLAGDAAGAAQAFSGEGIGPAVTSGVAAAEFLLDGRDPAEYPALLRERLGAATAGSATSALPASLLAFGARSLLRWSGSFRRSVLNLRFLHLAGAAAGGGH